MTKFLSAQEAAAELGISVSTLYSYVSRGLIRSEETEGKSRARRYYVEDVAALKQRKEARRNPDVVAERALNWGEPVLDSSLTLIEEGHLYYRGLDALELAQTSSLEAVAGLLWMDELDETIVGAAAEFVVPSFYQALRPQLAERTPVEALQVVLPLAAVHDVAAYDLSPAAVQQTGARILHLFTAIASDNQLAPTIAQSLQQAWVPAQPEYGRLLNAALILCADHELNVSSFTARCVASTNANPYAAVQAGLAALQGPKHGGHTERVEALFREAAVSGARQTVMGRLRRGEEISGFGHKLYPDGDPRGRLLLDLVSQLVPEAPLRPLVQEVVELVYESVGKRPTIDLGLVTLSQVLSLPPGAPLTLFAMGRLVGWIGQIIEQYALDALIRPRARYTGIRPLRRIVDRAG